MHSPLGLGGIGAIMNNPIRWTIVIPNWVPSSGGTSRHWWYRYKSTLAIAETLAVYRFHSGLPPITEENRVKRHVWIRCEGPGRLPDPDNVLKSLLDGMKQALYIVDDSPKWLRCEMPIMERSERRQTIITVEDME